MTGRTFTAGLLALALAVAADPLPGGEKGKDEAREIFDRMEKKLVEAQTVQATSEGTVKSDKGDAEMKVKLLLGAGGKVRLEFAATFGGMNKELTLISDGEKAVTVADGKTIKQDTPLKNFRENVAYSLSRVGLAPALMIARKKGEEKSAKDLFAVSDFKAGKREQVGGRDAHVISYEVSIPGSEEKLKTTLWIDAKTHLPLRRTLTGKVEVSETYQCQVNGKIADDQFTLPK
jgi:outer membrane lipoprotein-sorting protein